MIEIFTFTGDDDFCLRVNAAVTIVVHAARLPCRRGLPTELRAPFSQLAAVWELIPKGLIAEFTRAYTDWLHEQDRQISPNPRIDAAAITASTYAIAIVSIVHPVGEMELLKLARDHAAVEEEVHRRSGQGR